MYSGGRMFYDPFNYEFDMVLQLCHGMVVLQNVIQEQCYTIQSVLPVCFKQRRKTEPTFRE